MLKRFILIAMLVMSLCAALTGTAQASGAAVKTEFSMEPESSKINVGTTVTFTDHTVDPCDCNLDYTWWLWRGLSISDTIVAGNSLCLNPTCTQIRITFTEPGLYKVQEAADAPTGISTVEEAAREFRVFDPSLPPIFKINSPMTIVLPAVMEVLSKSDDVSIDCVMPSAGELGICDPYLLNRNGPDNQGLYHFRFKIPVGIPGPMEITLLSGTETPNGNTETFTLNVTASKEHFGDVRSCYHAGFYSLDYYDVTSSKVLFRLQTLRGKRWVTQKSKKVNMALQNMESPWIQRETGVSFGSVKTRNSKHRVLYGINSGHKLLGQGRMSTKRCT